jgi:hypothetical protein
MLDKIVDKKLANEFGKDYVRTLIALLKGNKPYGKVASGRLINSINYKLVETANQIAVIIEANDYLEYVDRGRRPGTYPPIKPLKEWAKLKGMGEGAAYAIRNKIHRFGIEPTNVINRTTREFETSSTFTRKYEEMMVKQLEEQIRIELLKNN